jgi:hypothetical protein
VPLVGHVFGIAPDATRKTVTFTPHLPAGWEAMSIAELPVGDNVISFAAKRTAKGVEYTFESQDSDWTLVLGEEEAPGAAYYHNGKRVAPSDQGVRMSGARNRVLVAR